MISVYVWIAWLRPLALQQPLLTMLRVKKNVVSFYSSLASTEFLYYSSLQILSKNSSQDEKYLQESATFNIAAIVSIGFCRWLLISFVVDI